MGGAVGDLGKDIIKGTPMDRIILHWSAGTGKVSALEKKHYHWIVSMKGEVVQGDHTVKDNIPPLKSGSYAAHTWKLNSNSVGVAVSAMAGATERPWSPGRYPIGETQLDALCRLVATLSVRHGVPVTPKTVLTHAEVQPTLGVTQRAKWDITWLPGMDKPADPVFVGDTLRKRIHSHLD